MGNRLTDILADNFGLTLLTIVGGGLIVGGRCVFAGRRLWRRRPWLAVLTFILAAPFLCASGYVGWVSIREFDNCVNVLRVQNRTGSDVSNYSFTDVLTGTPHQIADFHGKPVLVYWWRTECGHCHSQLGTLEQFATDFSNRAVVVCLSNEAPGKIAAFNEKRKIPGIAARANDQLVIDPKGNTPIMILIDKTGHVRRVMIGQRTPGHVRNCIEDAIAG